MQKENKAKLLSLSRENVEKSSKNNKEVVPEHIRGITTIYISQDLQPVAHPLLHCAIFWFLLQCQYFSKSF